MRNIQFVNDILEIDVDGRSFVIPTNDNTKLKKYNEFTLDGNKTGYVDETLLPDDDPDTGLLWMAYPILYFADDTKKEITSYLFSERPHKIIIENGLVSVEVNASGLVYKDVTRWANQNKDSDADDRPDVYDGSVEGSLAWLYASTEFNYNWQIKYSLTNSVITNDFGIGAGDIDIFPFGISGGNRLYDSGGNILIKSESVDVDGGTVDIYDVKGLTEVRETDRPGNNAGDVVVYDVTGGGTIKTRVTDINHVFVGDCWVENGYIRIVYSIGSVFSEQFYIYNNIENLRWNTIHTPDGQKTAKIDSFDILSISTDKFEIALSTSVDGDTYISNDLLNRGSGILKHLLINTSVINTAVRVVSSYSNPYTRFLVVDNGLHDSQFETGSNYSSNGLVISFFENSKDVLITQFTQSDVGANGRILSENANQVYATLVSSDLDYFQLIGALNINTVYYEAEAMAASSGVTDYTGVDAYPKTGITGKSLDAQNEYIEKTYTVGTDIDIAEHKLFVRAKDSVQVTDDFEISVYDVTASADILAPVTKTLTPAFDYPTVDFTLTEAMTGDTIRIRFSKATTTTNQIDIDYFIAIQAAEIEKQALRSLAKIETTKEVIKVNR